MGVRFTREKASVSLIFKRRIKAALPCVFELTNRVTASFTLVGNSADSPESICE
jgi:hypothetical protein